MPVTNEAESEAAAERIAQLFQSPPEPGTPQAEELVTLLRDLAAWEGTPESDPEDAAITYEIGGIKCDTTGCAYEDMSVTVSQYPQWVNRPCPLCGGNLLTEADFNTVQVMIGLTDQINRVAPSLNLPEGEMTITEITLDGSGIPKIKS